VEALPAKRRADDEELKEAVRLAVRRAFNDSVAKKPVTTVHLVRI
jgi:ribonuclease J